MTYDDDDDGRMKVMIEIQETWLEEGLDCKRSGGIPMMLSMIDHARDVPLGQTVTQVSVELGSHSVCVKILIFTHSAQLKHSDVYHSKSKQKYQRR